MTVDQMFLGSNKLSFEAIEIKGDLMNFDNESYYIKFLTAMP